MAQARPKAIKKPRTKGGFFWRVVKWGLIVFVAIPLVWVAVLRFVPPPVTFLMVQRAIEGKGMDYRWRPLAKISPNLVNAAIASEDARFCTHMGFDLEAIEKAFRSNEQSPGRIRGGSTISQQTAKNVFLWPQRDWIRKGLETYFTGLIEAIWGKRRIAEVYLNVAEMGPGLYGAEAAAQKYFGVSAANLSTAQAARLVAILPSPNRYRVVGSGPYVQRRSRRIGGAAGQVRREGLAACVLQPGRRGDAVEAPKDRPARAKAPVQSAPPAVIDIPTELPPIELAPPAVETPADAAPESTSAIP